METPAIIALSGAFGAAFGSIGTVITALVANRYKPKEVQMTAEGQLRDDQRELIAMLREKETRQEQKIDDLAEANITQRDIVAKLEIRLRELEGEIRLLKQEKDIRDEALEESKRVAADRDYLKEDNRGLRRVLVSMTAMIDTILTGKGDAAAVAAAREDLKRFVQNAPVTAEDGGTTSEWE